MGCGKKQSVLGKCRSEIKRTEPDAILYKAAFGSILAVFPWGAAVALPENAVKVAQIFVAHGVGNVVHVPVRVPQQKRCLGQPFFLNQLGIGLAGLSTDFPGQPVQVLAVVVRLRRAGRFDGRSSPDTAR